MENGNEVIDVTPKPEEPVEESKSVVVRPSSDGKNLTTTATDPEGVRAMQGVTLDWLRQKVELVKQEVQEVRAAYEKAVKNRWNARTMKSLLTKTEKRLNFYVKAVGAMEAGYILFPTTECSIFAVRRRSGPGKPMPSANDIHTSYWPGTPNVTAENLPEGEGEYSDSQIRDFSVFTHRYKDEHDREQVRHYRKFCKLEEVEFPLIACKPELMDRAKEAMALKVFDEIGLVGAGLSRKSRRGDPVIVGRIKNPNSQYAEPLTFLIGWFINTADI